LYIGTYWTLSTNNELSRLLSNPDNVILSSGLENRLADSAVQVIDQEVMKPQVQLGDDTFICNVREMVIDQGAYIFRLHIPSFTILNLLKNKKEITLSIEDLIYHQSVNTPIEWSDNLLTITTRRILNETV